MDKIEKEIQKYWNDNKIYDSSPDDREKYFTTICYPYQNGRLHLGHGYTITRTDFIARYQKLLNKNVLFPFGFHCTGMPIKAAADRLAKGDKKQIKTMQSMGINNYENFKDPYYWIKYFPEHNTIDLKRFGMAIDYRRSFITTDKNPYYDSFVKWQFNKLKKMGKLSFGKKYIIYSPLDQQPCGPHDRATGEKAKPKIIKVQKVKIKDKVWLNSPLPHKYNSYNINDEIILCQDIIANNLSYQGYKVKKVFNIEYKLDSNYKVIDEFKCYIPSEKVISRSGCECVVSQEEQWFINYGDKEWTRITSELLDNITTKCRKQMKEAIEWLQEWGCSRKFGLGTRLPFDKKYLIESLSDSTIYPSYYTVCHLLHKNTVDGYDGIIDPKEMTFEVWDYIFCDNDVPKFSNMILLNEMKKEFEYWYPVDMRVSGKDLLMNHLIMYLFNHTAIFDKKYWPRSIFVNGFIKVDNKKMSKQEGNFITLNDAITNYSADAVRLVLAKAGDGIQDHNFSRVICNKMSKSLTEFIKWVKKIIKSNDNFKNEMFDNILRNRFCRIIKLTQEGYENMEYIKVIKFAWDESNTIFIDYINRTHRINSKLFIELIKQNLIILCPIIPHTCEYLWKKFGENKSITQQQYPVCDNYNIEYFWLDNYYKMTMRKFTKKWVKKCKVVRKQNKVIEEAFIYIYNEWSPFQKKIIDSLKDVYEKGINIKDNIVNILNPYFEKKEIDKNFHEVVIVCSYIRSSLKKNRKKAFTYKFMINEKKILLENTDRIINSLNNAVNSEYKLKKLYIKNNNDKLKENRLKYSPENPAILFVVKDK